MTSAGQTGGQSGPSHAHVQWPVPLVQLTQGVRDLVHQGVQLVCGAFPVLGGERVHRQMAQADLQCAVNDVDQRLGACAVAHGAGQFSVGAHRRCRP